MRPYFATSAKVNFDRTDASCDQKISAELAMTKKVCLAPCLPGQEQETLSSVLGRWEEMGTFAWSGFFFCQAFAEGSWIVTSNKEHHNPALDGGEWACLAVVLTLLCK